MSKRPINWFKVAYFASTAVIAVIVIAVMIKTPLLGFGIAAAIIVADIIIYTLAVEPMLRKRGGEDAPAEDE